jgi:N-acetyl-anhydromuramoyl-L-alanine amidase
MTRQAKNRTRPPVQINAQGWFTSVSANKIIHRIDSPNFGQRPEGVAITLIVIHAISLPPDKFIGNNVEQFFCNQLDVSADPYFSEISDLKVSAHFYIRRNGKIIQFVATEKRAWHAGESSWQGRANCNDYSIGIELEGSDVQSYDLKQYHALKKLIATLKQQYPITDIVGHCDIAQGRKSDPGKFFDWGRIKRLQAR